MSKWDSRVRDHAAWKTLEQLGPALDKASNRPDLTPEALDSLDRVRALQTFIGRKLASLDARISPVAPLDSMLGGLQGAHQAVVAFESSGDAAQLDNANAHLDAAAAALPQLHAPVTTDDLSGLGAAATAYRTAVEGYAARLATTTANNLKQTEAVEAALAKLTKTLEAEQAKISTLVADYQSQFSAGQTSRVEEAAKSEAARVEKFGQEIASNSKVFEEAQATRQKSFDALIKEFTDKLSAQKVEFEQLGKAALDAYSSAIDELKKNAAAKIEAIYVEVQARKAEVETLVGVIGNLGASSGYQKAANQARNNQQIWQVVTVLSLLGVIGVALYSFLPPIVKGEHIPWEVLTARLLMTATVGILAAYAASQADKQHQTEKRNRQLALEFEALGAFLAPLPPEQQHKFRYEIGDRSFGRWHDDRGHERSPVTLLDLLTELQKRDPGFVEKTRDAFGAALTKVVKKG